MANKFLIGDRVFVSGTCGVPDRYLDRSGVITGTVPKGRGVQYTVAFPGRRVRDFRVSGADLTVSEPVGNSFRRT